MHVHDMYIILYVGAVVGENSHFDSVSKSNIVGRRIVSAEQTSVNDTPENCFISRCSEDRRRSRLIYNYLLLQKSIDSKLLIAK